MMMFNMLITYSNGKMLLHNANEELISVELWSSAYSSLPITQEQEILALSNPFSLEPGIRFHGGDKSSVTIGWTKGNRALTNVGRLWRYQCTFLEPQNTNC